MIVGTQTERFPQIHEGPQAGTARMATVKIGTQTLRDCHGLILAQMKTRAFGHRPSS